jgi:hypothetical protein
MAHRHFLQLLAAITFGLCLLVFLIGFYAHLALYRDIFFISILFFVSFSIVTYMLGKQAAESTNKFAFTNLTLVFLFGKLLFSVVIIVGYKEIANPESNLFVLPFFLVYLCYTAFETYFMMRLAKINNHKSNTK